MARKTKTPTDQIASAELIRVLHLAASCCETADDAAICRRVADYFDGLGLGPLTSVMGERQTVRQFVDATLAFLGGVK